VGLARMLGGGRGLRHSVYFIVNNWFIHELNTAPRDLGGEGGGKFEFEPQAAFHHEGRSVFLRQFKHS